MKQLLISTISFIFLTCTLLLPIQTLNAQIPEDNKSIIKELNFVTEDSWTLYATLYLPPVNKPNPIPGVVIMSEPDWVPRSISDEISLGIAERGMAALAVAVSLAQRLERVAVL